jgi:hypothetical protein
MKTPTLIVGLTLASALLISNMTYGQAKEIAEVSGQLRAIKNSEAEVRMPALYTVKSIATSSELLRQPIASSRKEIRFMTIDAVERIGVEAKSNQTKEKAIQVLGAPKRSESDALVERAYGAEFKIRGSM